MYICIKYKLPEGSLPILLLESFLTLGNESSASMKCGNLRRENDLQAKVYLGVKQR